MNADISAKYINYNGCSQTARFPRALEPGYAKLDERSFEEQLAYTYGLSKLFNYYDLNGENTDDWSHFLIDEAMVLAAISFIDPAAIEDQFKKNLSKMLAFNKLAKKQFYLNRSLQIIYDLALKFDTWYQNLKLVEDFINDEVNIRNEIANHISQKLQYPLHTFKAICEQLTSFSKDNHSLVTSYTDFAVIWDLEQTTIERALLQGKNNVERINQLKDVLQMIFQQFYEGLIYIRQKAYNYLNKSLQSQHHFPEVALLLSFFELYQHPQKHLNKLTQKYQDYYYRSILRQNQKHPQDAQAYLTFELDAGVENARVDATAEFIAGSDASGKNILFKADYPLQVNQARVVAVQNIFLEKDSLAQNFVRNIYSSVIPFQDALKNQETAQRSYAIFGESQMGKGKDDKNMEFAKIGYAIASPVLFMKSGLREIDLVLDFDPQQFAVFYQRIQAFSKLFHVPDKEMIAKLFTEAFTIELSAADGWLNIKRHVVVIQEEACSLSIRFDVRADQPALVACQPELHENACQTHYPVLKLELNNSAYVYPYHLFEGIQLQQATINTHVKGVKDLMVYNNIGPVNISNPFFPFGPMPKVGSYLLIGNNEIFQKELSDLRLHMEWFELPQHNQGFHDYFKAYGIKVDNTSFEAEVSVLNGGVWQPEKKEEKQVVKLFRSVGNEGKHLPVAQAKLSAQLHLNNLQLHALKQTFNYGDIPKETSYNNLTERGFLKIELSGPEHAFGHEVYPNILTEITTENAKSGMLKGKKKKALPNAPYTPKFKSLSVDYKSSASISLKDTQAADMATLDEHGQLFHIYPFGQEKIYPSRSAKAITLVPSFPYTGALFIGLEGVKAPQTISILFEMLDEFTISSEEEPPKIEWKFLAHNQWHEIKPEDIVRDDTNGFLRTGIIMINISADINRQNTILDASNFWLSVQCTANAEGASNIIRIYSQVMRASLVPTEVVYASDFLENDLPAQTIRKPYRNLKGIKQVNQPLASFNSRSREGELSFQTRVSERLKHRNRAIYTGDFERLVLEKFSQIERVTCLPNMTSENLDSPGSVLLVLSPFSKYVVNADEPRASSELLYEIKSYLKSFISPFVKLEVRNPSYERIRVICTVKFTDSHNQGFYMQQLNREINQYLSGNMGGDSHGSLVGKAVYCSDITTYIRTLTFVDVVSGFSIVQAATDLHGNYVLIDTAEEHHAKDGLFASKPWSVLIPSPQHQITVVQHELGENARQAGIDNLQLGSDFIIKE